MFNMLWNSLICATIILITSASSARILGIVPTPSYSHQIVFRPIWRELSLRGHQVTVLTTDPMRDEMLKNLTEIDAGKSYETVKEFNFNDMSQLNVFDLMNQFISIISILQEEQLQLTMIKNLIESKSVHFDLVIFEGAYPAMAAFSERFHCPLIQMVSVDGLAMNYHLMGNPSHPVLNPDSVLGFPENGNFVQRLISSVNWMFGKYLMLKLAPIQDRLVQKHFGLNYPSTKSVLEKTSMLFVNTDIVFHTLRPTYPNIVQIGGGVHFTAPKPLPKSLSAHLDKSTNGFIYFSLGSNVKSERLPVEVRNVFLETFAELPYMVLWKFEKEDLANKSDNVIISKWFPQQDIFKHPNIKLFISQGGLQSTEEAIYNHIPIIGIPFVADQRVNVAKIVKMGMGLSLDHTIITKTVLKEAILEIMNNSRYRDTVKRLAELARDQPMTGLERAIWWTEYVIRHKGAPHLKSPVLDLPVYQYYLLDVIGFCLAITAVFSYFTYRIIKFTLILIKKTICYLKLKVD